MTNKSNYELVKRYEVEGFSIEKVLQRYINPEDIRSFRNILASTGALISGSTAIQLFARAYFASSDLDIYVHHSELDVLVAFLMRTSYHAVIHSSNGYGRGFRVHDFIRNTSRVQVIATRSDPLHTILEFNLTLSMNIITATHAVSLFPYSSFVKEGWAIRRVLTYSEYADVGSEFYAAGEDAGLRTLGDTKSWVLGWANDHRTERLALAREKQVPWKLPIKASPLKWYRGAANIG
ncbi:hypothetical protein BDN72DRAFT_902775 [Pluteus cervinus]|uniref:Uncharacterized protein n=1 Tax=Pluteus cervinus TaxID=181527 RepID=A0ACD3ABK3_9AGAR|nr:hypothetical protein BDN72DRAFT_902775 [Pluteus cervinus]